MPGWRTFFGGCPDPDWAAIPEDLKIENNARAWPGRRNEPLPGAPDGAHICRAFDRIEPDGVRVLEGLGVMPIDLSPVVPDDAPDRHRAVIAWLLDYLEDQRPTRPGDWTPLSMTELCNPKRLPDVEKAEADPELKVENLRAAVRGWKRDRESYPGWLVCPWEERHRIRFGTDAPRRLVGPVTAKLRDLAMWVHRQRPSNLVPAVRV